MFKSERYSHHRLHGHSIGAHGDSIDCRDLRLSCLSVENHNDWTKATTSNGHRRPIMGYMDKNTINNQDIAPGRTSGILKELIRGLMKKS